MEKEAITEQYERVRNELTYLFNLAYIHDPHACRMMLFNTTEALDTFAEKLNVE